MSSDEAPETFTPLERQLFDAIRHGASMAEIASLRAPDVTTPDAAIEALMRGNARFYSGLSTRHELNAMERRVQVLSQTPFAVVLGCSDSRVPVEIIFDQGFGDLFIIRIAGNLVDKSTLGSIEYAVKYLRVHLVVVLGHEGCGLIKAAMRDEADLASEPEHLRYLANAVRPVLSDLPPIRDEKARVREAVTTNVRHQVARLRDNPTVAHAVDEGRVKVIGAFYEIASGAVDFMTDEEDLRL